jgi:DNA-directed RNA polymerase specialized sigma24 family protein
MTLSDALVVMAPSDSSLSAEEQRRREDATALVYDALGRLARRCAPRDRQDEVVQDVLIRLAKNRPGPRRYTANDVEAEAYLLKALSNRVTDLHRRTQKDRKRWESSTPDEDGWSKPVEAVDATTPEALAIAAEQGALLEEAAAVLFERAIPEIAQSLQNPDGFIANVRDLRAIAADDLTVDAIVVRESGQGDAFVKVRNRVYQRHKRTRGYLLEVPRNKPDDLARLSAWLVGAAVRPELEREVRRVAAEVFAPRVERGDSKTASQEQDS